MFNQKNKIISSMKLVTAVSLFLLSGIFCYTGFAQVSPEKMNAVYEEIKTPHKYGLVLIPADNEHKMDCPTIFRKGKMWYMTYLIFGGRGYETWLAKSKNL